MLPLIFSKNMLENITNVLMEGVKKLNSTKHDHAEDLIELNFSDHLASFKRYIKAAEEKRLLGQEIFDRSKERLVEEQKKHKEHLTDISDMYEAFRNMANSILKPISMKIKTMRNLEEERRKWDILMTNVERRLQIIKKEVATRQMWPQTLDNKKMKTKPTCKKLIAELQALAEVSKMFRKKLRMNGMLVHIRHVFKREQAFLSQLPVRATSLQNLKSSVQMYFKI